MAGLVLHDEEDGKIVSNAVLIGTMRSNNLFVIVLNSSPLL